MTSRDSVSPTRNSSGSSTNQPAVTLPPSASAAAPTGTPAATLLSSPSTIQSTSQIKPSSISEWQLYAVLQRANLLQYYDTFISQGGDDVQQLLEAGEEEFLEIMSLVGMACKPLHVRRLQKTLQQQQNQQISAASTSVSQSNTQFSPRNSPTATGPYHPIGGVRIMSPPGSILTLPRPPYPPGLHGAAGLMPGDSPGPPSNGGGHMSAVWASYGQPHAPGATAIVNPLPGDPSDIPYGSGSSPTLTEEQIKKLVECANEICKDLPKYEPKMVQNKKKVSRDLLQVMEMPEADSFRLEEFRRYAAIYGRFDAKRKADKPLTLHEVSVNEAAAQICLHRPALLTRRDELFPLARQVVRDAGYAYIKGPHRHKDSDEDLNDSPLKRPTPAESVTSSERSHTPSSSTAGTPPATGGASSAEPPLLGSPSSGASGSNGRGLETFQQASSSYQTELLQLDPVGRRIRYSQVCGELQRVLAEQEACKCRVQTAQDPMELTKIQRELNYLSQRQMELSDQQAILLNLDRGRHHEDKQEWKVKQEPVFEEGHIQEHTHSSSLDAQRMAQSMVGKAGKDMGMGNGADVVQDAQGRHVRTRQETKREVEHRFST